VLRRRYGAEKSIRARNRGVSPRESAKRLLGHRQSRSGCERDYPTGFQFPLLLH